MINLTCPSCRSELTIDEGFRGGVCRCFNCGSMMTVPMDPDHQPAESLDRPEQPADAPSQAGAAYTTPSGQTVRVTRKIPTAARRRKQANLAVIALFMLVIGGMIGLVIYGAMLMNAAPIGKTGEQVHREVFDIVDNPYTTAKPQFMGIPAADSNVWMIDSSAAMRDHFDFAKAAVAASLPRLGARAVQVIVWNESAPIVTPASPMPAEKINPASVAAKLDEVLASGGMSAKPAFEAAAAAKPARITAVIRNAPDEEETQAIGQIVKNIGAALYVIQINGSDPALQAVATASGGKLIHLSSGQLQRWYQEHGAAK